MPGLLPSVDPDGLLEYSVVYTDRSLNHMSRRFQCVMNDLSRVLRQTYQARSAIIVPGGGTYAMEAVARQFACHQKCLILRNGWFSYRWTQILEMGAITTTTTVLKARPVSTEQNSAFAPAPLEDVLATIAREKPAIVFAPHVETASGIMLPENYLRAVASATHACGGLLVLDCIASGAVWVNMADLDIDILISAPQKGWSGPPCCGFVMLGKNARLRIDSTTSSSFACDLKKWLQIMEAYESGGHMYHATMPTDSLLRIRDTMIEMETYGLEKLRARQMDLGHRVRSLLAGSGFPSVAAEGFCAPGVVVSYTDDPEIQTGKKFAALGLQTATGIPLQCDEPADFRTFRLGLFGLEKLHDPERTTAFLADALKNL